MRKPLLDWNIRYRIALGVATCVGLCFVSSFAVSERRISYSCWAAEGLGGGATMASSISLSYAAGGRVCLPSGESQPCRRGGLQILPRGRIGDRGSFAVRGASGNGGAGGDGGNVEPDLSVTVNGLQMPNPFVIGSGPPGTNYTVMKRAFDEGWGAVISKTVSLEASKVVNVTPRYARLRVGSNGTKGEIIGWENIELISDRPLETMLNEFKRLKEEYPDRILIASIMEEYNKSAWQELIERVEETGVDALEINFSCPHGMPERRMGAAVGQDCTLLEEVCGWINEKATVPVWAKMTPNVTDITQPARVALKTGCEGVAAINTIMSVMGINLQTLRPEPCVEGYSTPGGYSSKAVHPIALGKVMQIAKMMQSEFGDKGYSLSGIGGVETGNDAAEFLLLGANTVQVCTGVMMHGYGLVRKLREELKDFMRMHNFSSIEDFRGASLPYFTTHTDLVRRQREAIEQRKAIKRGLQSDKEWTGDGFVKETESMVSN